MLEAFFITWVGVVLAQASPGPNMMAIAGVGLSQGRRAAFLVTIGVASGMFVWAAASALGLGAFLIAFPVSLVFLKLLGGSYLLCMAGKALWAAFKKQDLSIEKSTAELNDAQAFRRGLLVILTNPKAALMWSAVATFLFGAGLSPWQVFAFGPLAAITAMVIYGAYALLFSSRFALSSYQKAGRFLEVAFGLAFGALGGRLLFDGIRDLRAS